MLTDPQGREKVLGVRFLHGETISLPREAFVDKNKQCVLGFWLYGKPKGEETERPLAVVDLSYTYDKAGLFSSGDLILRPTEADSEVCNAMLDRESRLRLFG